MTVYVVMLSVAVCCSVGKLDWHTSSCDHTSILVLIPLLTGGMVVPGTISRTLDLWFTGRGFKSWLGMIAYWPWTSCLHLCAPVTNQYTLVSTKEWLRSVAGKVTVGLALCWPCLTDLVAYPPISVIFVNENENENVEKRENNEFVNENEKMMKTKTKLKRKNRKRLKTKTKKSKTKTKMPK